MQTAWRLPPRNENRCCQRRERGQLPSLFVEVRRMEPLPERAIERRPLRVDHRVPRGVAVAAFVDARLRGVELRAMGRRIERRDAARAADHLVARRPWRLMPSLDAKADRLIERVHLCSCGRGWLLLRPKPAAPKRVSAEAGATARQA